MTVIAKNVTVLGAGSWGTALAQMAAVLGHHVRLYGRDKAMVEAINACHINSRYLPDIRLASSICAYDNVKCALEGANVVLVVVPAQIMSTFLLSLRDILAPSVPLILCAKGIEQGTRRFMSQVARVILSTQPLAVLSGPSFAADVARCLPTAVTIAAEDQDLAQDLAHMLSGSFFRCYASDDITGVELGGALKNVLALAVGAANGRGLGLSAQAALVTRGFAELRRLGSVLGVRIETMNGLAVLGDLMLTCSSAQSRNYSYGFALGRGQSTDHLPLAEGVTTAPVAVELYKEYGVEAPIIQAVADLVADRLDIDTAVKNLINRPLKIED